MILLEFNPPESGVISFFIAVAAFMFAFLCLVIGIIMRSVKNNMYKLIKKIGLISLLITGITLLLSAVLCSAS